jgi:ketosteroid isomerase-like protein
MKRLTVALFVLTLAFTAAAMAQAPAGQAGGRPNIFAPPANASGPIADAVNAMVTAFNNHDTAYLQKIIAPDAVWLDEDGHHLQAMVWMNRLMAATPAKKLSITNLRVGNLDPAAGWAAFNYMMEGSPNQVKGTNSIVFKKAGTDWQIALVHGAVDTKIGSH